MIPTVFMFGGEWKDIPVHWVNVAIGLFLGGGLTFVITQQLGPCIGLPPALWVSTKISEKHPRKLRQCRHNRE